MKISRLRIKNLFGIKEFDSDGKNMELDGKNGVGKSAVIDAIKYALTNKSDREYLIRTGETEGEVIIETDGGLSVTRKPRTNKADYKSIRQTGDPVEKNESFLRAIFTELQLNPVEFAAMSSAEQNRIILDLIDFKWDMGWIQEQFGEIPPDVNYEQNILRVLWEIQRDEGFYFLKRQEINREQRNKTAFIQKIAGELPPDYNAAKWEKTNLAQIYHQIESIRNTNDRITEARNIIESKTTKLESFANSLQAEKLGLINEEKEAFQKIQDEINDLKNKIVKAQAKQSEIANIYVNHHKEAHLEWEKKVAHVDGEAKQFEALAKEKLGDYADLQDEVDTAEKMKGYLNEYKRLKEMENEVVALAAESEQLTNKIEKARALPGEILANAHIPISGLTIKDGLPLINGLPVSNLSEGEKLDLCISIAVEKEGSLNLVLIDGIERLATERREDVYARLKAKGVQFIATRTTDDNELTVIEL